MNYASGWNLNIPEKKSLFSCIYDFVIHGYAVQGSFFFLAEKIKFEINFNDFAQWMRAMNIYLIWFEKLFRIV